MVKNLLVNAEPTGSIPASGRSLDWEDPLKKEMATIPVFLPGKFHGQRKLAGYTVHGSERVRHDSVTEQQHIGYRIINPFHSSMISVPLVCFSSLIL